MRKLTSWSVRHFHVVCSVLVLLCTGCDVYLCDFHREQSWERWTSTLKHGVSDVKDEVLTHLRRIAHAPVNIQWLFSTNFDSCKMCSVCYVTVYWWQEVATEYWHTIEVRRFVSSAFSALAFSALTLLVGQLASHVLCMLCMFSGCPLTPGGNQWTYTGFLQWVEFLKYVCVCWVVIHWLQSSASEYTIIIGRFVLSLQLLECVVYVVYV